MGMLYEIVCSAEKVDLSCCFGVHMNVSCHSLLHMYVRTTLQYYSYVHDITVHA